MTECEHDRLMIEKTNRLWGLPFTIITNGKRKVHIDSSVDLISYTLRFR